MGFITDRIRSMREGNVFTGVFLSMGLRGLHGGVVCLDGGLPEYTFGQNPLRYLGRPLPGYSRHGNMVNMWSVRILLELILV